MWYIQFIKLLVLLSNNVEFIYSFQIIRISSDSEFIKTELPKNGDNSNNIPFFDNRENFYKKKRENIHEIIKKRPTKSKPIQNIIQPKNQRNDYKILNNTNLYLLKNNIYEMKSEVLELALRKTSLFKSKYHIRYIIQELNNTESDKIFIHNDTLEKNEFYMMLLLSNEPSVLTDIIEIQNNFKK